VWCQVACRGGTEHPVADDEKVHVAIISAIQEWLQPAASCPAPAPGRCDRLRIRQTALHSADVIF
jgi:hypothetical protein